jgi:hypothetical protein
VELDLGLRTSRTCGARGTFSLQDHRNNPSSSEAFPRTEDAFIGTWLATTGSTFGLGTWRARRPGPVRKSVDGQNAPMENRLDNVQPTGSLGTTGRHPKRFPVTNTVRVRVLVYRFRRAAASKASTSGLRCALLPGPVRGTTIATACRLRWWFFFF